MSNSKISALASATTPLAGTETLPIVQSSATKQVSVANLTAGRTQTSNGIVQGTASTGYNFTANTPASGMTSQLLNWYEEGTWTPTNAFGTATFTTNFARYTRIGRVVHVQLFISVNTNSDSSNLSIFGLPYTCATNGWAPSIINTDAVQTALMRVASGSTALNAYTVSAETPILWLAFSGKYIVTQITYSI